MTISFACAVSHAPGVNAWPDTAPTRQLDQVLSGFKTLQTALSQANLDGLVIFTAEHWTNFFLDHISPFCIGRAATYTGPVEPWIKMDKAAVKGDAELSDALLAACSDNDLDLAYAYEMALDHGTMIPLHFLTPKMDLPIVPLMINTLAAPQPSVRRCMKLGAVVGDVVRKSKKRIGLIATGGMSHDPGERNHGHIDQAFDRGFLETMRKGDLERLRQYSVSDLAAAGAGTIELLCWIALAAALDRPTGEIVAYEPVKEWASGMGLMSFSVA